MSTNTTSDTAKNHIIPTLIEKMSNGASFVEVAASLHISKERLQKWLSEESTPEIQEALNLGKTLYEAYFERIGKAGMMGEIDGFKDSVWNKFMQNKFKWSDKSENVEVKPVQHLSDEMLQDKIKAMTEKLKD